MPFDCSSSCSLLFYIIFPPFFSVILERCMVAEGSSMLTYTVLPHCHVPVNQSANRRVARHLLNNSVLWSNLVAPDLVANTFYCIIEWETLKTNEKSDQRFTYIEHF